MAGGRFELAMGPTAMGLVSLNSNSETHMTVICDARLIYGGGGFHGYLYGVHLQYSVGGVNMGEITPSQTGLSTGIEGVSTY